MRGAGAIARRARRNDARARHGARRPRGRSVEEKMRATATARATETTTEGVGVSEKREAEGGGDFPRGWEID